MLHQADSEDSVQTRLIWVYAWCKCLVLVLPCCGSFDRWRHEKNMIWATSWENLCLPYANIKGTDQLAHPHSLISAFVVRCLDSIIPLVSISKLSSFWLVSVAEQAGLRLTLSHIQVTSWRGLYNSDVRNSVMLVSLTSSSSLPKVHATDVFGCNTPERLDY